MLTEALLILIFFFNKVFFQKTYKQKRGGLSSPLQNNVVGILMYVFFEVGLLSLYGLPW